MIIINVQWIGTLKIILKSLIKNIASHKSFIPYITEYRYMVDIYRRSTYGYNDFSAPWSFYVTIIMCKKVLLMDSLNIL